MTFLKIAGAAMLMCLTTACVTERVVYQQAPPQQQTYQSQPQYTPPPRQQTPQYTPPRQQQPQSQLTRSEVLSVYEESARCYGLGEFAEELGRSDNSREGNEVAQIGIDVQERSVIVMAAAGDYLGYSAERIAADQRAIFADYERQVLNLSAEAGINKIATDLANCNNLLSDVFA